MTPLVLYAGPGAPDSCDYVAVEPTPTGATVTVRERTRNGTSIATTPLDAEGLRSLMIWCAQRLGELGP